MHKKPYIDSSAVESDLASFRRQESVFIVLNLSVLGLLLLLHSTISSFWGTPSGPLLIVVGAGFLLRVIELIWLQRITLAPSATTRVLLTWASVGLNLALAIVLAMITDHEDSPYFVLLVMPVLEAAFRFHLLTVLAVIGIADFYLFFWVWFYFESHPPLDVGEYFEAAITSLIFLIVGVLVWRLVNDLKSKEQRLARNLQELERARERLSQEEKLALAGRLSSAIAHEIRNPVAMISSSIATAKQLSGSEREEMFDIASEEATRLVTLTTEFLAYARPRPPKRVSTRVEETLSYVADACRAHASQKGVQFKVETPETLTAEADPGQIQQALVNLIMNSVEASPVGGTVLLRATASEDQVRIDIENQGKAITSENMGQLFEPFFTTKPRGSGLGLPIARNIARAHGGDLTVTVNEPELVCFSLILPARNGHKSEGRN